MKREGFKRPAGTLAPPGLQPGNELPGYYQDVLRDILAANFNQSSRRDE